MHATSSMQFFAQCLRKKSLEQIGALTVGDSDFQHGEGFPLSCQLWREADKARKSTRLEYVSTLSLDDYDAFKEKLKSQLSEWTQLLLKNFPLKLAGVYRINLADDIALTLYLSPAKIKALTALQKIHFYADILLSHVQDWEIDNLKYCAKNFTQIARKHATLCLPIELFTQHESVFKKSLKEAGFQITTEENQPIISARYEPSWQKFIANENPVLPKSAIVVGAGLAGCSIARELAEHGVQVTVIDRQAAAARETSSHLAALLHPYFAKDENPTVRLSRNGFFAAHQQWQKLQMSEGENFYRVGGVIEKISSEDAAYHANCSDLEIPKEYLQMIDAETSAELSGLRPEDFPNGGRWWQQGAWADPPALCRVALAHPNIKCLWNISITSIQRDEENKQWRVLTSEAKILAQADVLILANAENAEAILHASHLLGGTLPKEAIPTQSVRGQINYLNTPLPVSVWPRCAVTGDGYVLPPYRGIAQFGATYEIEAEKFSQPNALSKKASLANLAKLQSLIPSLQWQCDETEQAKLLEQGWVARRTVSTDRLPLIGAWPDIAILTSTSAKDWASQTLQNLPRVKGLYVASAYASRGLTWSALGANLLTSQILGLPSPLERDLLAAIDLARFMHKKIREQKSSD